MPKTFTQNLSEILERWSQEESEHQIMSGREFDTDGTDSYHPQHPWEQSGHALYLAPDNRTRGNWPPVRDAVAAGPTEAKGWKRLPRK